MFEDFAHVWTPVAFSSRLARARPLRVEVAGTALVLFRDAHGAPAALLDRCPHRGVALSLGTVVDGCLQCPFHGWRFAGSGPCVDVPWNPDVRRERLAALAVPAVELAGQVWIHTSTGDPPPQPPSVHEALLGTRTRISGIEMTWNTHWTRAMENMLDWPHLPFVHRRSIGKDLVALLGERLETLIEPHEWGWRVRTALHGQVRPGMLDFRRPNQMNLHIPVPGRELTLAVACIPMAERRTKLLLSAARNFARLPLLDGLFNRANRRIAAEDRAIVESSEPPEIPPARADRSVPTDRATLRFRHYYFSALKGSACAAPPA
ncbi:MAG: Rieske 2Fe-2S domain-containing protein [Steroidobacteraceae bacterium]